MTIKAKVKSDLKLISFKTYADFELILESVKSCEGFYSQEYQDRIPYRFSFSFVNQPFCNV